jgi:hypothetical protein
VQQDLPNSTAVILNLMHFYQGPGWKKVAYTNEKEFNEVIHFHKYKERIYFKFSL